MKLHRIDLDPAPRGRAFWAYEGRRQGESAEPLFAAARWLLAEGLADPGDRITTYRGEMLCLTALVRVAAGLSVKERDRGGLQIRRWRPPHWDTVAAKDARNDHAGRVVADARQDALSERSAAE